jgi:hypothetical protein
MSTDDKDYFHKVTEISVLVSRIDERTKLILEKDYITRGEYLAMIQRIEEKINPLKSLVFGMVGLLLTGIVGAILKLVVK